jgi:formylglycine-generating enzyme required for sulfatase activity
MKTTQSKYPAYGSTKLEKLHNKQASLKRLPLLAMLLILAAISLFTGCGPESGELPEQPAITEKPTATQEPVGAESARPPVEEQLAEGLHEPWAAEDWEKVIELIEQIRAINPNYDGMTEKLYAAHVNYGLQLIEEGNPDEAVAQFSRALEIKPDGAEARAGLEQVRTRTVRPLEQSLHESWAIASDDDKRAEEWEEVIGLIEQILAVNPGNADMTEKLYAAHVNYGLQLVEEGNLERAKTAFTRALDVKPDGGEATAELSALAGETPIPQAPTATSQPPTATPVPPISPSAVEAAMIAIPAGEFTMGSQNGVERPPHAVFVDTFEMDQLEVTNEDFEKFVAETGYVTDAEKAGDTSWRYWAKDKPQHPVVKVSWNDAKAFCEWAGKRLPTEAEWEKAARGSDQRIYPWGNDWDVSKVNAKESGYRETTVVGSFPAGASPYGVMDMAGNVSEWTSDWFQPYPGYPGGDNEAQYFGEKYRVIRGGGWFSDQNLVRTTERSASSMTLANDDVGFRCTR